MVVTIPSPTGGAYLAVVRGRCDLTNGQRDAAFLALKVEKESQEPRSAAGLRMVDGPQPTGSRKQGPGFHTLRKLNSANRSNAGEEDFLGAAIQERRCQHRT